MGRPQQTRNATDWRLVQFMANPRQVEGKGFEGRLLYRCRQYCSSRDRVISGKDSTHYKIYDRFSEGLKWNLKTILIPFPKWE